MSATQQISKIPPNAIDLEEAVLGALLIDKSAIDEVFELIKNEAVFYKPAHQAVFVAIKQLVSESLDVDILTVTNRLEKNKQLENIGDHFFIVELSQKVASSAHVANHCLILLECWMRRQVITNARNQIELAYDAGSNNILDKVSTDLDYINDTMSAKTATKTFAEAIQGVVKRVERLTAQKEMQITGVTTGFKKIDKFTGGWRAGQLIVIAARPGMGKSALILKNVIEVVKEGHAVGVFSLEMSIDEIATRSMAIDSHFHLRHLFRDGFKTKEGNLEPKADEYFLKLFDLGKRMEKLGIHVDDTPSLSINDLYLRARTMKRKHDIKILFVDYLQLVSATAGNREQEIGMITRRLKSLAKELKIPVVALSQLSRSVETRAGDKRPKLSDLRESGSIEQDANVVCFIYRPEYYGYLLTEDNFPELWAMGANTELIFAKFRSGSLATKGLLWDGNKTKFSDPSDVEELEVVESDNPF